MMEIASGKRLQFANLNMAIGNRSLIYPFEIYGDFPTEFPVRKNCQRLPESNPPHLTGAERREWGLLG